MDSSSTVRILGFFVPAYNGDQVGRMHARSGCAQGRISSLDSREMGSSLSSRVKKFTVLVFCSFFFVKLGRCSEYL